MIYWKTIIIHFMYSLLSLNVENNFILSNIKMIQKDNLLEVSFQNLDKKRYTNIENN